MSEPEEATVPNPSEVESRQDPGEPDGMPGDSPFRRAVHRPLNDAEKGELLRLYNETFPPYSITRLGLLHFADQYVADIPGWLRELNLGDVLDAFQELRATGRMRPGR